MKRSKNKSSLRKTAKRPVQKESRSKEERPDFLTQLFYNLSLSMKNVNESKIFAGFMVLSLNVATKMVPIKISKTMEMYLRHSFSRNLLIFIICWVGTRDLLLSLLIAFLFILFFDFLLNEEHPMCILPESFIDYHMSLEQDPTNSTNTTNPTNTNTVTGK